MTGVHCRALSLGLISSEQMNLTQLDRHPKVRRTHLVPTGTVTRNLVAKRRSSRMSLTASVRLSGEDRLKCSFTTPAKATNLNKHGAAVQLSRDLCVGSVLLLRNQFGIEVSARVIAQLTASQGLSSYGIEFVEHDDRTRNFWGISFPPNA